MKRNDRKGELTFSIFAMYFELNRGTRGRGSGWRWVYDSYDSCPKRVISCLEKRRNQSCAATSLPPCFRRRWQTSVHRLKPWGSAGPSATALCSISCAISGTSVHLGWGDEGRLGWGGEGMRAALPPVPAPLAAGAAAAAAALRLRSTATAAKVAVAAASASAADAAAAAAAVPTAAPAAPAAPSAPSAPAAAPAAPAPAAAAAAGSPCSAGAARRPGAARPSPRPRARPGR